jgi:hypothetical protein
MFGFRKLTAALIVSAVFAFTPATITAQGDAPTQDPPVDVEALRASLLEIGQEEQAIQDLANQLVELPLLPTNLPEGFVEAEYVDPTLPPPAGTTRGQQGVLPLEELTQLPQIEETVVFTVAGDPSILGGSGSTNSLSYVIFDPLELADDSITGDTLDQIEEGIKETFDLDESGGSRLVGIAEIDDEGDEIGEDGETLVEGLEGRLVTYTLNSGTTNAATQLYIVPIENVFIFSLVTVAADGPVDPNAIAAPAEKLTLAGIEHLEDAVTSLGPR